MQSPTKISLFFLLCLFAAPPSLTAFDFTQPYQISIPRDANEDLQATAHDLAQILSRITQTTPVPVVKNHDKIQTKTTPAKQHLRHRVRHGSIGATTDPPRASIILNLASPGESRKPFFRFKTKGDDKLIIEASTPDGLARAPYAFLFLFANVRFYFPGELGEHIPENPDFSVHNIDITITPPYVSRVFSGLKTPEERLWGKRNLLVKRYQTGHNLHRVFDDELFEQRPELFALVDGRRIPAGVKQAQPNIAHPDAAKAAADAAIRSIRGSSELEARMIRPPFLARKIGIPFGFRNPELRTSNSELRTFSLAINDTLTWDESALTKQHTEPTTYFRHRPNYSNLVFDFMNRTAEILEEDWKLEARSSKLGKKSSERTKKRFRIPNSQLPTSSSEQVRNAKAFLTCYAYFWAEDTPDFPVHPRVLPYLTADRSQYYDPAFRDEDLDLIRRWSESGVATFGLYEYSYGDRYLIPRVPIDSFLEGLRHAADLGATGYYTEIYPTWHLDGLKPWQIATALWNPFFGRKNAQNKTNKTVPFVSFCGYKNLYGPAAEPMQQFWERCAEIWNSQPGPARWLKYFRHPNQAEIFNGHTQELRELLNQAETQVQESPASSSQLPAAKSAESVLHRKRIQRISNAFTLTEALVTLHQARLALTITPTADERQTYLQARDHFQSTADHLIEQNILPSRIRETVDTIQAWNPLPRANHLLSAVAPALTADLSAVAPDGAKAEAPEERRRTLDLATFRVVARDYENRQIEPTHTTWTFTNNSKTVLFKDVSLNEVRSWKLETRENSPDMLRRPVRRSSQGSEGGNRTIFAVAKMSGFLPPAASVSLTLEAYDDRRLLKKSDGDYLPFNRPDPDQPHELYMDLELPPETQMCRLRINIAYQEPNQPITVHEVRVGLVDNLLSPQKNTEAQKK